MSDQSGDSTNTSATPQNTRPAESSALTVAPQVVPIVPELADHPTGAFLSWSLLPPGQTAERTLVINMASVQPVAGFEFRLIGGVPVASSGGRASDVGFNVVSSEETRKVLGHFDVASVTPVGPGNGILTQVTFRPEPNATEVCLVEPVVGDPEGNAIEAVLGGCVSLE